MFNIYNRRYTGNKRKLMDWIETLITKHCKGCKSFFDVFAGTGSVTNYLIEKYDDYVLNDFLYSNEIIFNGFFLQEDYDGEKLKKYFEKFNELKATDDNYVSINFGDKYFSNNDARVIGDIRQNIEDDYINKKINYKEYAILISSLLYSLDKISNTVGHYEAYIKTDAIKDKFRFELIKPIKLKENQSIKIYRKDSNKLSKNIKTDIAFIDPPYNSRQYSRFYHVLETIVKWDKPELYGTALKPKEENMSEYCKSNASKAFEELINNINAKYIVVTYNNTYTSKSSSSQNKISLEQIKEILSKKGKTKVFEKPYKAFNAGKTNLNNHKEYVFITEVEKNKENLIRSPFFYVGDKYKLMPQLKELFPQKINRYIEPFVGGGSSFLNTVADEYLLNDLNESIIKLHKEFLKYRYKKDKLLKKLYELIENYNLTCSYKGITVPEKLKKQYPKTYYAKYNKEAYYNLRADYNLNKKDMLRLYLLLIYGFNHMIRFNSKNDFNLPVGNVDFNKNVYNALINYITFIENKNIKFYNKDYKKFINDIEFKEGDFVFLDPPYLVSSCEYNKMWDDAKDKELFDLLDELNSKGVKFGITNLIYHKGNTNHYFNQWCKKYKVYNINSNYISFNDNTIKNNSKEVYVTNYEK